MQAVYSPLSCRVIALYGYKGFIRPVSRVYTGTVVSRAKAQAVNKSGFSYTCPQYYYTCQGVATQ